MTSAVLLVLDGGKKNFFNPLTKSDLYAILTIVKERSYQMDKRMFKKEGEELQQYLAFRRKGARVPAKKGKGSYNRKDFKKGV